MSKIMNYIMDLQDHGVLIPENAHKDSEPDFLDYARDYMATEEYAQEHDEQTKRSIEGFLESVREHGL